MATEVTSVLPDTGVWNVDSSHSNVRFKVANIAVTTYFATFLEFGGSFDAATGSLAGWLKPASIQTLEVLRKRLLEPDFFDAEQYPEMTFASTSVTADGNEIALDGQLAIKDSSKPIHASGTFGGPVAVMIRGERQDHLGMDLRLEIDRRDFGLTYNHELPDGPLTLGWNVVVEFSLDFARSDQAS